MHINTDIKAEASEPGASGVFQPNGPVVTDVVEPTKPEPHKDIQAVRNEYIQKLDDILKEVSIAKEEFAKFKANLMPGVEESRRAWYRSRPERTGRTGVFEAWQNNDPELNDLDSIRDAKRKVDDLKSQLAEAEGELSQLQEAGTPRSKYTKALFSSVVALQSAASYLELATIEDLIFSVYGKIELRFAPTLAIENTKIHPDVIKFQCFRVTGLDPMRDSFGDIELASAHNRIVSGVSSLRALIKSEGK